MIHASFATYAQAAAPNGGAMRDAWAPVNAQTGLLDIENRETPIANIPFAARSTHGYTQMPSKPKHRGSRATSTLGMRAFA